MFDIHFFRRNPRPFFDFAQEIYPGQFVPSPCHRFIRALETHGKLLRNYTQNIDTLEQEAGITRVLQCHGSFNTASCMQCGLTVDGAAIKERVFRKEVPLCPRCPDPGPEPAADADAGDDDSDAGFSAPPAPPRPILKPDIIFFGQDLPAHFYDSIQPDCAACDLVIVIGSSLKVVGSHFPFLGRGQARFPRLMLRRAGVGEPRRAHPRRRPAARAADPDQPRAAAAQAV